MKKILSTLAIVFGLLALTACDMPPIAESHQLVTPDGSHKMIQVTMSTGVYGTPTQTVLAMYNKYSHTPIALVEGQSKRFSAELVAAFLALGPSILHGEYKILAEEAGCPPGTICGTLIQVSNTAGANADAGATAGNVQPDS